MQQPPPDLSWPLGPWETSIPKVIWLHGAASPAGCWANWQERRGPGRPSKVTSSTPLRPSRKAPRKEMPHPFLHATHRDSQP